MKISELENVKELIDQRGELGESIHQLRNGDDVTFQISWGNRHDLPESARGPVIADLEKQLAEVEGKLQAAGVELDVPAYEEEAGDEDDADEAEAA